MGSRPLAHERRQSLVERLRTDGRIDASAAAVDLETSVETIRKDLIALESQGLATRVHGGAIPLHMSTFEPDVASRVTEMAQKRRIALAAVEHIPAGGSVFIDAGSTTGVFAEAIPAGKTLTVFTNTLTVATTLAAKPGVECSTLGGRVRATTLAEVGAWATRSLSELHVDVAFVGTNAVSEQRGLSTPDSDEAAIKRLMIEGAATTVLLADHTKFGKDSLVRYASLDDLDTVITGVELGTAERAWVEATQTHVEYA